MTPKIDAAMNDAMPVLSRVFSADRGGRYTQSDVDEIMRSAMRQLDAPEELRPDIERTLTNMARWASDEGRRKGLLMTEEEKTPPDEG